ncbi:hypothetical protein R3P38DRAFT_2960862 [Favolaschia claudopus]|uniref:F-box domain-containing protein n=1 Tax=Favolaschia claudopus TaxID=2862362 RepID=A0AAW0B8B2_9AGAR
MSQASSLTELQQHIEDLAAAIEAQKAALQDLVSQHKEAQNRLNFFVDPMARLPLEIQSHIFLCVEPKSSYRDPRNTPHPNSNLPPVVFLSVCRLWRDIALSTPKLWNKLELNGLPRPPNYLKFCNMWLDRARTLPLSVSLRGSLDLQQSVLDLVGQYVDQLENLTLDLTPHNLDTPNIPFTLDQGMQFPCLKRLSLQSSEPFSFGSMGQWLGVLAAAPLLSTLDLDDVFFDVEDGDEIPSAPLIVASLDTLYLGSPFAYDVLGEHSSTARILRYLTLPALKSLTISSFNISYDEFFAFLSRSSPPLESFQMIVQDNWTLHVIARFARLVPTLVTLELSAMDFRIAEEAHRFLPFFEVLGTSDLLPHLRKFTLSTDTPWTVDYGMLRRILTMRATGCPARLECFELCLPVYNNYTPNPPPIEVEGALRRLIQEGMKIHIGSHAQNML